MSDPYWDLAKGLIYTDLMNNNYSKSEINKKLKVLKRIKELEGVVK